MPHPAPERSWRLGLLFTEMGKESSAKQLAEYWILPVFTVVLTALSLLWATIGVKALRMPNWLYTAAACPNYTSLPLLLIESLKRTGVLGRLLNGQSDTVDDALSRAKLYFLVTVRPSASSVRSGTRERGRPGRRSLLT